ncbi:MAG: hypothetical protein M0P42_16540 [Gallionella sp.]|nr:hypothetical protein [Gallionella sp.]
MSKVPKSVEEKGSRVVSDNAGYIACMTIIKARLFTIQKILNNEIFYPYEMLRVESIYFQFRMMIELLYLSSIVSRKKKLSVIWPRSEKEYQPSEIRKFLKGELDDYFPYPFIHKDKTDGVKNLEFFDRPISEADTYEFFNRCHQYLHEPNPYKKDWSKRDSECAQLINEAVDKVHMFWRLLQNHYRVTELDDGEKVGIICSMGNEEKAVVVVANVIPDK